MAVGVTQLEPVVTVVAFFFFTVSLAGISGMTTKWDGDDGPDDATDIV
jgi:hypothetical protein